MLTGRERGQETWVTQGAAEALEAALADRADLAGITGEGLAAATAVGGIDVGVDAEAVALGRAAEALEAALAGRAELVGVAGELGAAAAAVGGVDVGVDAEAVALGRAAETLDAALADGAELARVADDVAVAAVVGIERRVDADAVTVGGPRTFHRRAAFPAGAATASRSARIGRARVITGTTGPDPSHRQDRQDPDGP